jgi:hypothetical protein
MHRWGSTDSQKPLLTLPLTLPDSEHDGEYGATGQTTGHNHFRRRMFAAAFANVVCKAPDTRLSAVALLNIHEPFSKEGSSVGCCQKAGAAVLQIGAVHRSAWPSIFQCTMNSFQTFCMGVQWVHPAAAARLALRAMWNSASTFVACSRRVWVGVPATAVFSTLAWATSRADAWGSRGCRRRPRASGPSSIHFVHFSSPPPPPRGLTAMPQDRRFL